MTDKPKTTVKEEEKLSEEEIAAANLLLLEHGLMVEELSPEEAVAKAERLKAAKARAVQVLSRGRTLDAVDIALSKIPKGFVGEFARDDEMDIQRKESLGFELVEREPRRSHSAEHPTGDTRVRVGDAVLMQIPEEEYVAIHAARTEVRQARVARNPAEKERKLETEGIGVQTF